MTRLRAAASSALILLVACGTQAEPACPGEEELDLVITPSEFNYPELEDGARLPVYVPLQGGVFTELDLEVTGVSRRELSSFTFIVRLAGGDVIANPAPTMTFPAACQDDGSILLELIPVSFMAGIDVESLDEQDATLVVQMHLKGGEPPLTREFDVVLDYRTLN